ncbi:MAG: hypothetical protein P8J33_10735 [Pirellulaceae bacterium]|nr:hypothetical protein [Pirellulaceae bacterium]
MNSPILDAEKVASTVSNLKRRINDRFPHSGLCGVCDQLERIADSTRERIREIKEPIVWAKLAFWFLIVTVFVLSVVSPLVLGLGFTEDDLTWKGVLELGDPIFNEIIVIGALFFFMFKLETLIKRKRALKALHELRAIAHVIDMHQLTKDPDRVLPGVVYMNTPESPVPQLTSFELRRYLDYCTEMLSLTGKLAAVYVQNFDDEVALAAVNEVEALTTGLSGKIWQKITILHEAGQAQSPPGKS